MKIHPWFPGQFAKYGIIEFGVSVQAVWRSQRNAFGDSPTWKHFSIIMQTPWTWWNGRLHFNPLRFGFYHDCSRAHLYLGLIYLMGDIGRTRGPRRLATYRVGPFSLAHAEKGRW